VLFRSGINEGEILALFFGETGLARGVTGIGGLIHQSFFRGKEALMNIRYRVELSQSECDQLTALLSGGKHPARKLKRAQILLAADAGASDAEIAARVVVGGSTVYRTKRRFVEGNLELALAEEPRPGAARKLTGKEEALLVATACSDPPAGRAAGPWSSCRMRWSS
jgi:hypothetical protein